MRLIHQRALFISCFILLFAACGGLPTTPSATTEYNRNYDFSRVHKIAIQPIPKDTLETMLISDGQISRMNQSLSAELARRGFQVVAKNVDADMFLSWRFVPAPSTSVATFNPGTQKIPGGMLYVSMIDPILLQPVWRSSYHADLRDKLETGETAQYRTDVVEAVLAQFPPDAASR